MYAYFIGEVTEIEGDNLILEVNGIGYNIKISNKTSEALCTIPSEVKIYTYTSVREDAFVLYGFLTKEDLKMFKKLITVNGVGPKGAMAILDIMSVNDISLAIIAQDAKSLSKANGIGTKTAERIIIDLKDKVNIEDTLSPAATDIAQTIDANSESVEALVSLGYSKSEAVRAIKACEITPDDNVEDIIKKALRKIQF